MRSANPPTISAGVITAKVIWNITKAAEQDVPKIQAPLLLHFAELDRRINEGWPVYEAALKQHKKNYTAHMYLGVNHGFHNDSTPRYDEASANLAWERTILFFKKYLA